MTGYIVVAFIFTIFGFTICSILTVSKREDERMKCECQRSEKE